MPARLAFVLKAVLWVVLFIAGAVAIRFTGELIFYYPGVIAKTLSYALTGSTRGMVTSLLFFLVAAVFVLAIAALGWGAICVDKWLDQRRNKL